MGGMSINKHWSIDTTELEKDAVAFSIWKLEQKINFGIGDEKINKAELVKHWDAIVIDPFKRKALALVI